MLILTRKVGEKIRIGNDVEVVVLGIKGRQARIGVMAPPDVQVHREEVFTRVLTEGPRRAQRLGLI